jgi:bis(5'-nucleosyl)-tetraphosphatase (symmetrical)
LSTYAIGDIHGCIVTLERLLARLAYRPGVDRLWLVGDLVNRGPDSLAVLRWAREQGDGLVTVLGNHDLHLLACAAGVRARRPRDTFDDVLVAPDRDELLDWLRGRPLAHREGRFLLVHAGVPPGWRFADVMERGAELERLLRRKRWSRTLKAIYDRAAPRVWRETFSRSDRARAISGGLTRLRMCDRQGRPVWSYSGPPEEAPPETRPWYFWRAADGGPDETVLFGHWAALGRRLLPGAWGLDSACSWGATLTAVRLEDGEVFEEPCADLLSRVRV